MLVLKQNTPNSVPTPPAGKGTIFLTDQDDLAVKTNDGNVTTFPTVGGANTEVFFNDQGAINASSNLTFNKTTQVFTVTGNVAATGVKTDNLYYANGSPWDLSDPGGSNTQIQFNDDESFGGSANFTFNKTGNVLTLVGTANISDINTTGNILVGGNLTVNGNVTYVNVETLAVEDPIISIGGGPNGAPLTSNDGKDRGTALQYFDTSDKTAFMGWDASNAEFGMASLASISNDVVTFSQYGNLRVGYIIGNGSQLSAIAGGNVTGQVGNALVAGTVYTNAQPNITSVGTLTSLDVTGNIAAGNLTGANLVSANFVTGTLTTAAQPNITSVGKLTSVLIGSTATAADYPNAVAISSQDNTGLTGTENVGLVGEGVGNGVEGIGLLGLARANGTQKATGVQGVATVTNSADTGAAVGLRGYSTATHSGGYNIGVLGNAVGSGVGNYAFYIQNGGVASIENNTFWDLNDNSATSLAFNSTGKANILSISTVDGSEGVGMSGTLNVTGNANVGNLGTTNFVITGNVTGNLLPSANVTYNLGSDTQRWNNLYLNGNTITLGSQTISANTTTISLTGLLSGNGGGLTNLNASNLASGTVSNARLDGTYTITVNGSANTVRDGAQANITSLGTLTGLGVNGNIVAVNVSANTGIFSGNAAGLTNIPAGNISGQVANALVAGTVYTNAQPNITSVGTLDSLAVTGNATAGNVYANSGTVGATNLTGTLTTNAQPNITSVGTLSSLSVTANVAAGNLTTTGVLNVTGTGQSSIAGNLAMNNKWVTGLSEPVNATDAATKQYVDDVAQGLHTHDSCAAATPDTLANISGGTITYNNGTAGVGANLVTTGTFNLIDGVNVQTAGTRIVVKNEANAAHNGIYTWSNATVLTRATDFDTPTEMAGGDFTFVTGGTLYDNTGWVMTDAVTTVGTSPVNWTQFSGAGTYNAGTGLTLTGTVFSVNASQSQITSVGTLTGLNVNGTVTASAFTANTGVFTGNGSGLTALNASNISSGTLDQSRLANSSLTVNGTSISLGGSGTITANTTQTLTLGTYLTGTSFNGGTAVTAAVDATPNNTASKVVARDSSGNFSAGTITATLSGAATTAGTVTTAAQPNITSVGTLTSLAVTGNITAGNVSVSTGTVTLGTLTTGANTTAGTVTGNWTLSAGSRWNATYADLAEKYVSDASYEPGTVLVFGGEHEVTLATENNSSRVAGVVSTNPAYLMNAECQGEHTVELALQGRVPVKVSGQVQKGDLMVSGTNGHAVANNFARAGTIIGKALENFVGESGVIEVVVGRF